MLMAGDMSLALDPALIGERVGLDLDPWQATLLRERPKRSLLLCSRQAGKSTVTALLALHVATYEAPALVLLLSPSQRQSGELFRTVMMLHGKLSGAPELTAESALRAEMANGSRVVALPGNERTVRGYAGAKLVVLDEAARIDDDLLAAVRPMLAINNGSLIALTTPAGKRGWFYEAWNGDDTWHRARVPASGCPRLSSEFLAEERRELGPMIYSQEYELEFVDDDESVWGASIIDSAFTDEVKAIWQ